MKPNVLHPIDLSDRLENASIFDTYDFLHKKDLVDQATRLHMYFERRGPFVLEVRINGFSHTSPTHNYLISNLPDEKGHDVMEAIAALKIQYQASTCPVAQRERFRNFPHN